MQKNIKRFIAIIKVFLKYSTEKYFCIILPDYF